MRPTCAQPTGIDISQRTLDVTHRAPTGARRTAQFANTAVGHRQLIRWLTKGGQSAHVVLEATGVYGLDLAVALHAARRISVMVLNPEAEHDQPSCIDKGSFHIS